jgi:WD40 repeat protein
LDIPSQQNYVGQVEWSLDGGKLATIGETGGGATSERAVKIWDSETGKLLGAYEDGYAFIDIAWNPQHTNQLLISGTADHYGAELILWDVHTQDTIWKVEEPNLGALYLAWNPDGYWFAISTTNYENDRAGLSVHSEATGTAIAIEPTFQRRVLAMKWTSNTRLAISGLDEIEVWDISAGYLVERIQVTTFGNNIAWSPDGTKIVYNDWNSKDNVSKVQIIDVPDIELTPEATQEAVPTP